MHILKGSENIFLGITYLKKFPSYTSENNNRFSFEVVLTVYFSNECVNMK